MLSTTRNLIARSFVALLFTSAPSLAQNEAVDFFVGNRALIHCKVTSREEADRRLMLLAYTNNSIKEFEQRLKKKIDTLVSDPNFCKDFKAEYNSYDPSKDALAQSAVSKSTKKPVALAHDACLEAKDYEGCVKVKSGNATVSEKVCDDNGFCQANGEIDGNGHLMPKGWWCKSNGTAKMCLDGANVKRVPHKGQPSRYIALEALIYEFKNATAGTAARSTTIGSAQTNCYGYGTSISCTTTPPATMTIPGTPGTTAGWVRFKVFYIRDCKDKTTAMYWKGKPRGNWIKKKDTKLAAKFCPIANTLPARNIKL